MEQCENITVLSSKYIVLARKSIPIVAWYLVSKLSYMNLVMIDVLPTHCSPRKTSLNFFSGLQSAIATSAVCPKVERKRHETLCCQTAGRRRSELHKSDCEGSDRTTIVPQKKPCYSSKSGRQHSGTHVYRDLQRQTPRALTTVSV